jgi:lysine 2,3-aminomutase
MTALSLIDIAKRRLHSNDTIPLRPPVDPAVLGHRELLEVPRFRDIPAYRDVTDEEFFDHNWQAKKSITRPDKLLDALRDLVSDEFIEDATMGFARAPMSVRVSPYLLSLIDWSNPYEDPIRRQFIPLGSTLLPDHPKLELDSLHEQAHSPVPGLIHRYYDKALFLPLDTCPVYCRYCTRSYAVGVDTEQVDKTHFRVDEERWRRAYAYIATRPELEDIVVSGGDAYNLRAEQIRSIGEALLSIPHVRRIRLATKGPAVMPQKVLSDDDWFDAVTHVVEFGRRRHKEVAMHTHFNHPNEITGITRDAMNRLFERGITVRNQAVMQRGVNDDKVTMQLLLKRLGHINVHPYYVYLHDLVRGVEDLRTTLQAGLNVEKGVRGITAGFNTPTFVVDAPGGGGKRDAHSFEFYDRTTGISVFQSPNVKTGQLYLYFDPISELSPEGQQRWADPREHARMIDEAIRGAACAPS